MRTNSLVLFGILCITVGLHAENGVTTTEIVLGQSAPMSGPAERLGKEMQAGLNACFNQINAAGGVKGHRIRLISKDDGYEPEKAIANVRELLETDKVFGLIGSVGTPTSQAVVPICEKEKVPYIAPFTGAEFLRNPLKRYVINLRSSYGNETEKMAAVLVDTKKLTKIACFYQNDGYGQAGLTGITAALKKRNLELVASGNYERNTTTVKSALLRIRAAQPEAVVMIGTYKPCAEFIKLARSVGMNATIFCNISFVDGEALSKELGEAGEGVLVTQAVSSPRDQSVPIVKEYTEAIEKTGGIPGYVSLEGYLAWRLFCAALGKIEGDITREAFITAVEKLGRFDLGGFELNYSAESHAGMRDVFMTVIKGGEIKQGIE